MRKKTPQNLTECPEYPEMIVLINSCWKMGSYVVCIFINAPEVEN